MAEGRTHVFSIEEGTAGTRLDRLLPRLLPDLSRNRVQQLIAAGRATVNDAAQTKHYLVRSGDRVALTVPPPQPAAPLPEAIPLEILHEDDDLIAVNKPAGMVVHPAPGHAGGTLVNALLGCVRNLSGIGGELRPGIIHRLDKGTSGVVLVAKNDRAHRALAAQFAGRSVAKTYLALAFGTLAENEGVFELSMGRDTKDRKKISTHTRRPRVAITRWKVLGRLPGATLLELHPETGRTHQIRVHLAAALHPVLGDPAYGPKGGRESTFHKASLRHGFRDRLALHAWRIAFTHPTTHTPMELVAPLPPELAALVSDTPSPLDTAVRGGDAAGSRPSAGTKGYVTGRRGGAEGRPPGPDRREGPRSTEATGPRRLDANARTPKTPRTQKRWAPR